MTISSYRPVQDRPIPGAKAPDAILPHSGEATQAFAPESTAPTQTPAQTQPPRHHPASPQFSNSLVIALLNSQEQFQMAGPAPSFTGLDGRQIASPQINGHTTIQSTVFLSNGGLPGGLDLSSLDPADAANALIDAGGSNGQIDFSGIQMLLGGLGEDDGPKSVRAAVQRDWDKLTQGRGSIDADDLTKAIQALVDGANRS